MSTKNKTTMTPPTLVAPTGLGQMIELAVYYENQQRTDDKNPEEANIITNLNYDSDTFTGTLAVNFTFEKGVDADGNPRFIIIDPILD